MMILRVIHWGKYIFANVRDHRHRTAGATDAGEERASASGVTAGRCSVDRSVRIFFDSKGLVSGMQIGEIGIGATPKPPADTIHETPSAVPHSTSQNQ
jgi:hypothetical protein